MSKKAKKDYELELELEEETKKEEEVKKEKKEKAPKKKMTANDKRKIAMKIAGWIMALAMLIGAIATIVGPLMYR